MSTALNEALVVSPSLPLRTNEAESRLQGSMHGP